MQQFGQTGAAAQQPFQQQGYPQQGYPQQGYPQQGYPMQPGYAQPGYAQPPFTQQTPPPEQSRIARPNSPLDSPRTNPQNPFSAGPSDRPRSTPLPDTFGD